jgi:hypothetical protein
VIRVRYGEQGIEGMLQHRTAVASRRG